MLSIYAKFAKPGGFIRNVTTMLAGNATAQAISFLAAPVITRLYAPNDFGVMIYISSIIAILSVLSGMRYETAIVLPKDDNKALNLFALCMLCTVSISVLLTLLVVIGNNTICNLLKKSWLSSWLWIVPIGVFMTGSFNSLTFLHTRKKLFTLLSLARISTSVSTVFTKIVAGLIVGSSVFWLISGNIIGVMAAAIILSCYFLLRVSPQIRASVNWKGLRAVAREYSKFPKYAMPTGLLNSLSQNLPVLLFAHYFSQDIVGYFGLASAVLRQPISLIGESLGKVYLQKAAELQSQDRNLRDSMIKTTLGLIGVGIVPFGLLTIGGRWIFSFVFGEDWATAGLYAQILAPWLFLGLINPPATQVIIVRQALQFNLLFNIVTMLMRFGSIVLGYYLLPQPWAVIGAFSASGVLVNLFYISYAFSLTKE